MNKDDYVRLMKTQSKEKAFLIFKFAEIDTKKKVIKEEFLKRNCSFNEKDNVIYNEYIAEKNYKKVPAIVESIHVSDKGDIVYNLLSAKTGMFLGYTDNKKSFIEKVNND